jgi:hypothetical protein
MSLKLSTGLRNAIMGTDGFKGALEDGVIDVYTGTQPTDADAAETGTKLMRITVASGAFTSGVATNGLSFAAAAVSGVISKASEVWSGVGLATGTAGWYRFYANTVVTGASTSAVRLDGACAVSGSQLNMSSTSIATGATVTVDSAAYTLPGA